MTAVRTVKKITKEIILELPERLQAERR